MSNTWEGSGDMPKQPEPLAPDRLTAFINENKLVANDVEIHCSDGRHTPEQSNGGMRVFGGHVGILMAYLEVLEKKQQAVDINDLVNRYKRATFELRGMDIGLEFHTDDHNPTPKIGCGHIKIGAERDQRVLELFQNIIKRKNVKETIVYGEHEEKGILYVKNLNKREWTVNSFNPESGEMYFVVDLGRIVKFFEQLTPKMGYEGIEASEVFMTHMRQVQKTAEKIAKGLPQYNVTFDKNGKAEVKPTNRV